MVSQLSLIISLVFMLYLCHFRVEANSRPFQKRSCWMCDAPRCDKCVTSQWTSWNQCSAPCGLNGYQSRSRVVHQPSSCGVRSCPHLSVKEWRPCNRWCQNGGTPARWGCHCPLNYIGDCCEAGQLTITFKFSYITLDSFETQLSFSLQTNWFKLNLYLLMISKFVVIPTFDSLHVHYR